MVQPVYIYDQHQNPSYGADVPNTLYSLGGVNLYPAAHDPNSIQPAPTYHQQQSEPNYDYPPSQAAYEYPPPSMYAQSPFVPLAYAPLPNQPQYSHDPEIEALLHFTYNNYQEYEKTLETGQRPDETPCVC